MIFIDIFYLYNYKQMDLNEVNLLGRVVRDTEIKMTPTGQKVGTNSIATGEKYTNQAGQKVEDTQFTDLVLWGKVAEIAEQYLTKWKRVFIKWKIKTRNWDGEDWKKRYKTEVIVKDLILLDGGTEKNAEFKKSDAKHGIGEEISVEDIPF